MGRWAQARRRGTVTRGWPLDAPAPTDFTVAQSAGAGTDVVLTRNVAFPPGATSWIFEVFDNGSSLGSGNDNSVSVSLGVYPAGHTVGSRVRWATLAGPPLSDWSVIKSVVTT